MERIAGHSNHAYRDMDTSESAKSVIGLLALTATGTALGALLWQLTGLPEVPSKLPHWRGLIDALSASTLSDQDVVSIVTGIGWMALAYFGVTIALQVLCESAVRAFDGAAWARTALRFSNLVTLPPIRRMVSGAVGGALLVGVWFRAVPSVAADGHFAASVVWTDPPGYIEVEGAAPPPTANGHLGAVPSSNELVSYTVVEGDTLWNIAERFYGDGSLYVSVFDANVGRTMATGEPFTDPRVIRPGWVLDVPMPAPNVQPDGERVMYTVRDGDSLWRMAENFLGGGLRWTEIWELNKGHDMGAGRTFVEPGNIHPGWVLELPVAASPGATQPTPEPTEPVLPSPSLAPTAVAPTDAPTMQPTEPAPPSPVPLPLPQSPSGGGGSIEWPPPPLGGTVLAVAAGLGGIGGVALIVRQLRRRDARVSAGSARPKHSTGDAGRVDLAARSLLQALRELGFDDVRLVLVRETERVLGFTIDCAPGDAEALANSRFNVGRRLACAVDAENIGRTRMRLKLSRFQRLAGMLLDQTGAAPIVLLVPVGASDTGIHYVNLTAVGSLLLTGNPADTSQITSSWMSSLSTLRRADQLAFLTAGPGDTGGRSVSQLATELEADIVAREASQRADSRPATVSFAVLAEQPNDDLIRLDTVVHRGPEHDIFTVCVAHQPVDISNMFGARLAFQDGGGGADSLALTIGRDAAVTLMPVTVRAQPLTRHTVPASWPADEAAVIGPDDVPDSTHESRWEPQTILDEPIEGSVASPLSDPLSGSALSGDDSGIGDEAKRQTPSPVAGVEGHMVDRATAVAPQNGLAPAADSHHTEASALGSRQAALLVVDEDAPATEATDTHPKFDIKCFGSFQVLAQGREVDGWTIQKARELLAYLVARGGTRVTREEAADALWPDEPADRVGHLLSNAAYYVRRTLKESTPSPNGRFLTLKEQRYQLQSGIFRVDLDAFDAHLRRAETLQGADALVEYDRALAIYRGDFLGNEPYEWADAYRRDYQRRVIAAAHDAGRLALDCRDVKKAIEFYQTILDRDPIDEEAARAIMRSHAKLGDTNAVRRMYKALQESLRRELEDEKAEPLPETIGLFRELTAQSR